MGAARVNLGPELGFEAVLHTLIFVQPTAKGNETYLLDFGFGKIGPCRPILLSDSKDNIVWGCSPPERHRLTLGVNPASSLEIGEWLGHFNQSQRLVTSITTR